MAQRDQNKLALRPATRVEVTVLVDNYSDILLMEQTDIVRRPLVLPRGPMAEHGLSLLVRVSNGQEQHTVLMDTGLSKSAMIQNAALLGLDLAEAEALVISHGHWDHLGGLDAFLKMAGPGLPVAVHPDAFNAKRLSLNGGSEIVSLPCLSMEAFSQAGAKVSLCSQASTLAGGMIAVLGEITRQTEFEKGFPAAQALVDDNWQTDPLMDDQGLAIVVENKGLVVISGCAHAGIVNTVLHAQQVTGETRIHAVMGGFHLTGSYFKPFLRPTVKALEALNPEWLVPMHCTGWQAAHELANAMPEAFLVSTVGSTFCFKGK